jgi:GntR family transcriptional regulator/MocR family aminotransferase
VDLPLAADRAGPAPLTIQIVGQLRAAMTDGQLAAGERLPSTRALAATLGVSRTVVTGAYAQLFAEGWIEGRHGSGTYVADGASTSTARCPAGASLRRRTPGGSRGARAAARWARAGPPGRRRGGGSGGRAADGRAGRGGSGDRPGWSPADDRRAGRPSIELRPGIPWTAGIDRAAWRRAWRSAGAEAPPPPPNRRAAPRLRVALSRLPAAQPGRPLRARADHGDQGRGREPGADRGRAAAAG